MLGYEELDEAALEKLAWLIAEEFVDTCDLLSGMDVPSRPRIARAGELRMVMHWSTHETAR